MTDEGSTRSLSIVTGTPEINSNEIKIGKEIGGGCFGKVYKGMCRGKEVRRSLLNVQVAIKQLLATELDEETMEEFKKEVEIMT